MTYQNLYSLIVKNLTRNGNDRITGAKIREVCVEILNFASAIDGKDEFPDWRDTIAFNTTGIGAVKYCKYPDTTGNVRIFETRTDNNVGNVPPSDPAVSENVYWREVSASSGSGIKEYASGIFPSGLIVVLHNHSTLGYGLYVLVNAVRPFYSVNIENEILNGDWYRIGGSSPSAQSLSDVLSNGNDASSRRISNLANPTDPQDADTKAARDLAISQAFSNATFDDLQLANLTLKNNAPIMKVLWEDLSGSVILNGAGMTSGTLMEIGILGALYEDSGVVIWMLSRSRLYRVDFTTGETTQFSYNSDNYQGDRLPTTGLSRFVLLNGTLYFTYGDSGFYSFDTGAYVSKKYDSASNNYSGTLIPGSATLVHCDSNTTLNQVIFSGVGTGIVVFDVWSESIAIYSAVKDNYSGDTIPSIGINALRCHSNYVWISAVGGLRLLRFNLLARNAEAFTPTSGNYTGDLLPNTGLAIVAAVNNILFISSTNTTGTALVRFDLMSLTSTVLKADSNNYNGDRLPKSGAISAAKPSEDGSKVYFSTAIIDGSSRGAIYIYDIQSETFTKKQYLVGVPVQNDVSFINLNVLLTGNDYVLPSNDILLGHSLNTGLIYVTTAASDVEVSFSEDGLVVRGNIDYLSDDHVAPVRYVKNKLLGKMDAEMIYSVLPMTFDRLRYYHYPDLPLDILYDFNNAVPGMKAYALCQTGQTDLSEPFMKLSGSGDFVEGAENYYEFTFINSEMVLYTVRQIE